MRWVKLLVRTFEGNDLFGRIDDDGLMRVTCVAEHPDFAAWLAAGNTPEPWNPEPAPVDEAQSSTDAG